MIEVRFGYLQEATFLNWRAGRIEPLADYASIVARIQSHERAYAGWFHPPLGPVARESGGEREPPLVSTGFALPATHLLSFQNAGWTDECANFMIALFGMLKGRRLQREEWQHFYKAPLERKLSDFDADNPAISHALDRASDFWQTHVDVETRRLAFGALHWHLFAQLYQHDFERFNAQYMALDACHELAIKTLPGFKPAKGKRRPHAERAWALSTQLGVPVPAWANISAGQKSCALSERRNALIHEAMYGGQPVGFAYPAGHEGMELELTGLVARLLLRLMGMENEYTRSDCTMRSTISFSFNAK